MNPYEKALCDAYRMREGCGYRVVNDGNMTGIFWNDPWIQGLNSLFCPQIGAEEIERIRFWSRKLNGNLNIHCVVPVDPAYEECFHFEEISRLMMFEARQMLSGAPGYEICEVRNEEELRSWCALAAEIFGMQKDEEALFASLCPDFKIEKVHKYIGKAEGIPAAVAASSGGEEACLIEWVGVLARFRRRGLCKAMLQNVINHAFGNGYGRFVLSASAMGYPAYVASGFQVIREQYDYMWKGRK